MSRAAPGARRTGSRLFVTYAVASLVPVIVLGAVLAHGYRQEAVERGLDHGRAQAAVIEEMAIAPALSGHDLGSGMSGYELQRLRSATDLAIFNGSVARLRVRSFTGRVVFSDDGTTAGAVPSSRPRLPDGGGGRHVGGHRHRPAVRRRGRSSGSCSRSSRAPTAGRAGCSRSTCPTTAIAAKVHDQMVAMYRHLAGGLGLLYAVLALISWYTTRRLRRVAAQREHQALHDHLTGLPNREWFRLRAEEAVARGRRGEPGAIVLDRPRPVQGGQRHARAPRRRRAAAGRGVAAVRRAAHRRHGGPARR